MLGLFFCIFTELTSFSTCLCSIAEKVLQVWYNRKTMKGRQIMNNNDRLTRLRYALDIKDSDMFTIFSMGGVTLTQEDVVQLLKKLPKEDPTQENQFVQTLTDQELERFLNGLIISQRGKKEGAGEPRLELNPENANNILLKKVKIALSLTTDDILDILATAGVEISNSELSAVLRKEGHRNYKPCGDRYARNFLKGLAIDFRS